MNLKKKKGTKYTVVAPGTIHSHRDYNVAVAVHDIKDPVTLKVGITGPSYNETQTVELVSSEEFKQITFKLPPLESGDYNLTAEGVKGLEFKDSTKLQWECFKPYIKIETDKGKYKPGDTINYRVMFLDENLLPVRATDELVIWFEDSKGNRIHQEKHIKTINGVYTGKLELSEFAILGSWSLQVKIGEQESSRSDERINFEVEKYVLPKYSVKMETTKQVSVRDGELDVILASYTYGNPVNGKVVVTVDLPPLSFTKITDGITVHEDYPGHSAIGTAEMVSGKAKLTMDLKEFASSVPHNSPFEQYAKITATVEEDFTGVKLQKSGHVQLFPYRYIMFCLGSPNVRYKPDKEYEMACKITFVDGTLVTDTKSVVKATFTEKIQINYGVYTMGEKITFEKPELPEFDLKTFVFESHLNEESVALFKVTLPDLVDGKNFARYYTMEVEFADEKREVYITSPCRKPEKIEHPTIYPEKEWFRAEVQMPKGTWRLKIGQEYQVILKSSRPLKYFVYNIVGRGNILETKRVELAEPQNNVNITLKPTFLTAPKGRLYFYYVDTTGEFRYTETTFSVEVELQNKIEIKDPEKLLEGYDTSTPCQGGYTYFPGQLTGVVTMTNAFFFYERRPSRDPMKGFKYPLLRITEPHHSAKIVENLDPLDDILSLFNT